MFTKSFNYVEVVFPCCFDCGAESALRSKLSFACVLSLLKTPIMQKGTMSGRTMFTCKRLSSCIPAMRGISYQTATSTVQWLEFRLQTTTR
jgi:hypothetical protein